MRASYGSLSMLALLAATGCTSMKSYWQQHYKPHYTITPEFYTSPPKRLAVLPLTPMARGAGRPKALKLGAVACREALYRRLSVKPYENVELRKVDERLASRGLLARVEGADRKPGILPTVDVLGLHSLLDPRDTSVGHLMGLPESDALDAKAFEKAPPKTLGECTSADTLVKGVNREYGWLYAVLFSFVKVRAQYEMLNAESGQLLWSGNGAKTSFDWVLSASFLTIPLKFVTVWLNARGETLERSADDLALALAKNIPDLSAPARVAVRAARKWTPVFSRTSYVCWRKLGSVAAGTPMKFLLERDGWFQVQTTLRGKDVTGWVFRADAELVDEKGSVLRPRLRASTVYLEG